MKTRIILLTGPAGVGKTSVLKKALDILLLQTGRDNLYYVAGDAFAHLNCPWEASAEQLDLKYQAMFVVLQMLAPRNGVIFIDDVFRREQDLQTIINLARQLDASLDIILMESSLEIISQRNQLRESRRQIIAEDKLRYLFQASERIMQNYPYLKLPNMGTIEETANRFLTLVSA